ncbi:MAG: C40 family peptidase [Sulfurihydrogenibium sp.]|nr:C40 family peptidase [Sulfurihydrogenibium sp.]
MNLTGRIIAIFLGLSIFVLPSTAKTNKSLVKKTYHYTKTSKKSNHMNVIKASYSYNSYSQEVYNYYNQGMYGDHLEPNKDIYKYAVGLLGTKYTFGGTTIDGIDCSSFVQHVFELAGFKLPRTAREQARYGYFVRKENLKPGDLLFFATYASFPSHVGIYIGDGKMIHASSRSGKVEITDINQDFYMKRFLFAKRIPANIKDLKKIEDVDIMQQYINNNTSEKNKESDPIAKIIQERTEKN